MRVVRLQSSNCGLSDGTTLFKLVSPSIDLTCILTGIPATDSWHVGCAPMEAEE